MHRDPGYLATHKLALAHVQADSHLEVEVTTEFTIEQAQRIARAGPSKLAKKPSPTVFTSAPRKRTSWRRTCS